MRELYQRLLAEGWIDPWLDEEKLLSGQDWDLEIEKPVEDSDAVIVCMSEKSVTKEGYVQKEIRKVLDIALEKPEETVFVIPLRLDDCELPRRLRAWHYVDYFPAEGRERAFQRLLQSLNIRFAQSLPTKHDFQNERPVPTGDTRVEEAISPVAEREREPGASLSNDRSTFDIAWGLALILYFSLAGMNALVSSNDTILSYPDHILTLILGGVTSVLIWMEL